MQSRPELHHIPGERGWPLIGHLPALIKDNFGFTRRMVETYGPVYRCRGMFGDQVVAVGHEAAAAVLGDRGDVWSAEQGLGPFFAEIFPETLMVLDGAVHRRHRRIMQAAFGLPALRRYLPRVKRALAAGIADWGGEMDVYRAHRALTLTLADQIFLGLDDHPDRARISRALVHMVASTAGVIRRPLPFTRMRRGQVGRRQVRAVLRPMIAARRAADDPGDDLLGLLVGARDEDGDRFTDDEVVNHIAFMWLAAHDTLTTAFSALCDHLARQPGWQARLRDAVADADGARGEDPALAGIPLVDQAFKEALRLQSPVGSIPRVALKATTLGGYDMPAGTPVFVNIVATHRDPDVWPDPDRFDPARFGPDAPPRPRFSWIPYGSGPHTCLGARHAAMIARVHVGELLRRFEWTPLTDAPPRWTVVPINRPRGGVRLKLTPRG